MYTPPPTHKKQAVKQASLYLVMTLSVLVIVFVLVLFMLGYRFDRTARTIEQGGLLQLSSIPSGANLTINSARLGATTSTKTTLSPGQHAVTMARSGYTQWQKTIDLKRGSILWLNYARLIPTSLPVENIASLPAVTSSEPSPNRERYALTTEKNSPTITLVDIRSDKPEIKTLTLPEESYTKPEDAATESFRVSVWDASNRYVLLAHAYDNKTEWIVADLDDITRSKNISAIFDVVITSLRFSPGNSSVLYALMNGDVRKIDIEAATISAPLVRNVAEFSLYDRSTIVYTSTVDAVTKSRSVGYVTEDAREPRVVRSYSDEGLVPLHISIDKYYNQPHVAIAYGSAVEILSGALPRSDSDNPLSLTAVATMSTPEAISYFSSKTAGRFFIAQHGKSYSVYDLELQKATTTPLRGEGSLEGELRWIDGYTVWSSLEGKLRFYEFDGANQNDIMPIIPGQNPALTSNNRYLYAPTQDDAGAFHLSRVRLILP